MNYKSIRIGALIKQTVIERGIEISRICNFMKLTKEEVEDMYNKESIDSELLLRWSKLLDYDFFRLYSQHLILYAPVKNNNESSKKQKSISPQFRKNLYTKEVIDYVLSKINKGEMTKSEIIERYQIPKTTLYKWINKYNNLTK
ncbi:transposase [Empedobacter brevis]|uniref:Transposase n=1 Tax=Empedobacter brevis TaxID=247 RepID=A0AAJ1QCF2_9FLAO|nr:transposase [Empedobacter brevis]MDM1071454.1 transposase [Empedobacter brevis]QHC85609.1 transposase [Empedobacter brevis]